MTHRTGTPTLREVVDQIDRIDIVGQQPAIQDNGRAVRLSKGKGAAGETIYGIRTRPTDKGREWNFARRIAQERALVEKFEKEIDTRCGKKGMGRKLTKGVGAYDKFLNPKLDAAQLAKLGNRAEQIQKAGLPPPGFKMDFDENDNLKWVGRFEMNGQARTTIKSGLAIEFNKKFQKPAHKGDSGNGLGITEQFLKDSSRSDMWLKDGLNRTNLRNCQGDLATKLRDYVGGSGRAAYNFSALLTQAVFGDLLLAFQQQTGLVVLDASENNSLTFEASKNNDRFTVNCTSQRRVGAMSDEKMYYLDQTKSTITETITLSSDLKALADGNAKGVKLVGNGSVDCVLYPLLPKEGTADGDDP
jgi:hypothetical protein